MTLAFTAKRKAAPRLSNDDIDELPGNDDDALDRRAGRMLRDLGARPSGCLDCFVVGAGGNGDFAAKLAVDLQHELDLILRKRAGVRLRPRRVEQRTEFRRIAELVPQGATDVRRDRIE